jgi:hypothetical protein
VKPGPKPKDTCKWGHSMTGDNVRWTKRQGRIERGCAECNRQRNKKKKEQRRTIRHVKPTTATVEAPLHPAVLLFREELAMRDKYGRRIAA